MRSPVSDLRVLHYAERVVVKTTTDGEDIYGPGEPVEFLAVVGVPRGEVAAAMYGAKLPSVRTLTTGSVRLREGMYVWIDALATGNPDYTVIADRSTARQYTCDVGKRGAFGG